MRPVKNIINHHLTANGYKWHPSNIGNPGNVDLKLFYAIFRQADSMQSKSAHVTVRVRVRDRVRVIGLGLGLI